MNAGTSPRSELLELIHAHRDAALSSQQCQRLEEIVSSNPELMQLFVAHQLMQTELEQEFSQPAVASPELPASTAVPALDDRDAAIETWRHEHTTHANGAYLRRLRTRRIVQLTSSCIALLAFAILGWWILSPDKGSPVVVEIEGDVQLVVSPSTSRILRAGERVPVGSTIRTLHYGSLVLRFEDATTVQINSGSNVRIELSETGGKRVYLTRGVAIADVAPQPAHAPMMIETPHASVQVVGTRLVSSASNNSTRVELTEGKVKFTRHIDGESVSVSKGLFAEASQSVEPLLVKKLPDVLEQPVVSIKTSVASMAVDRQNMQLITAKRGKLTFWSADGQELKTVEIPLENVRNIALVENRTRMAVAGNDRTFLVIDPQTGNVQRKFQAGKLGVRTIAIDPAGHMLAYVDNDIRPREAVVWLHNPATGKRLKVLKAEAHEVITLHFSPDGQWLAGGTRNGKVVVWNTQTGAPQIIWPGKDRVRMVRFSSDGKMFASCDHHGIVRVWNCHNWSEKCTLNAGRNLPCLAFSPDNQWLAAGTQDGRVRIWNVAEGDERLVLPVHDRRHIRCLTFVDNDTVAASCGIANVLTFWKVGDELNPSSPPAK